MRVKTRSSLETKKSGAKVAVDHIKTGGHLLLLRGPLGVGKTEWARGFIQKKIGIKTNVTSPSYSIINPYKKGKIKIYHVDLYRLKDTVDLESVGFWDLLSKDSITLVEWGELLPPEWANEIKVWNVEFKFSENGKERLIEINPLF